MGSANGLEAEIKALIVEALALEDVQPEEIETEAPLFVEGLGLDSIDALELAMALEERYGVAIEDDPERNQKIFASVSSLAAFVADQRAGAEARTLRATPVIALSRWFAAEPRGDAVRGVRPRGRAQRRRSAPRRRGARRAHRARARAATCCCTATTPTRSRWVCSPSRARGRARGAARRRASPGRCASSRSKVHGALLDGDPPDALADLPVLAPARDARAGEPRRRSRPRARPRRAARGAVHVGHDRRGRGASRRRCAISRTRSRCSSSASARSSARTRGSSPPSRRSTSTACCSACCGRSRAGARSCAARCCTPKSSRRTRAATRRSRS